MGLSPRKPGRNTLIRGHLTCPPDGLHSTLRESLPQHLCCIYNKGVLFSIREQRPSAPVSRPPWLHVRDGQRWAPTGPSRGPDLDAAATRRPETPRQRSLVEDSQGLGAQGE